MLHKHRRGMQIVWLSWRLQYAKRAEGTRLADACMPRVINYSLALAAARSGLINIIQYLI